MDKDIVEEMSVVDHLRELRKRIMIIIFFIAVVSIIIYSKVHYLIDFFMIPINKFNLELVYFSLTDGFIARMELSLVTGTIIVIPVILYQIAKFINPGLTKKEKRFLYRNLFFISILLILGMAFGYILLIPYVLKFLILYGEEYMNPLLSGITYFNFVGLFCFFIGLVFLIPYVIVLLGKLSLLTAKRLKKFRKYVIIFTLTLEGLFISSAGIIPWLLLALPIIILYEIGIWIVKFMEKKRNKN
ncbi:twin-arginine translocase subunit TatC [Clostridium sp. SHJSY1]|uniref:twin-arginine translocase subunit TatC n=1 Tax=Clostridium sp. SHJSY1 TaxID=2942483 RepID=UPI00287607B2|nr:twin-arginine translocase subunit TatC [Clostridium sp. SHJSY1]MDS0527539.1 twin-arginine translocase subunit TatC [Clostridium sp. SHJSY1]